MINASSDQLIAIFLFKPCRRTACTYYIKGKERSARPKSPPQSRNCNEQGYKGNAEYPQTKKISLDGTAGALSRDHVPPIFHKLAPVALSPVTYLWTYGWTRAQ